MFNYASLPVKQFRKRSVARRARFDALQNLPQGTIGRYFLSLRSHYRLRLVCRDPEGVCRVQREVQYHYESVHRIG